MKLYKKAQSQKRTFNLTVKRRSSLPAKHHTRVVRPLSITSYPMQSILLYYSTLLDTNLCLSAFFSFLHFDHAIQKEKTHWGRG